MSMRSSLLSSQFVSHEVSRPIRTERPAKHRSMDKATNEECAHPDTTFRAAGIAACTGLAAYRGRYPGLPAHLGLLDDPTGLCHRSIGCQTACAVTVGAFEKAKMTKYWRLIKLAAGRTRFSRASDGIEKPALAPTGRTRVYRSFYAVFADEDFRIVPESSLCEIHARRAPNSILAPVSLI